MKKQVDQLREQKYGADCASHKRKYAGPLICFSRKRLGKKEQNAKATKKEMGKRAQSMLDELAARHARELASLETAKAAYVNYLQCQIDHLLTPPRTMQTDATLSAPLSSVSVSFTAALAAAGNSPYPKPGALPQVFAHSQHSLPQTETAHLS